jgi:hypothetical protein
MVISVLRRALSGSRCRARKPLGRGFRPAVEGLERRLVPYALSGSSWSSTAVTISFMPDGTISDSGAASDLFAKFNGSFATSTWEYQFAKAAQTWASVTPLNFRLVPDSGAAAGSTGLAQGDPNFGDIRIGAYTRSDAYIAYTYYPNSYSTLGGDMFINAATTFHIGTNLDLYSAVLHEFGHAIGMAHSTLTTAVMYPNIMGVYTGLSPDDIAGAQAIYGARPADPTANGTLATASALGLDSTGAFTLDATLESTSDQDYYQVVMPATGNGTLTVTLDAKDFSLLTPTVTVYDANGTVLGQATASTYGQVLTVNLSGLTAGQAYTIGVKGATNDVFSIGTYQLSGQFGGVTPPGPTPPAQDAYDPNNTVATASNLGTLSSLNLTNLTISSSTEVDYFAFTAGSTGTFKVSTSYSQVGGTGGGMTLAVLSSTQSPLGTATTSSGSESLSVSLTAGQTYYIEVFSPGGSWFNYSLSMSQTSITTTTTKHKGGGRNGGGALAVVSGDGTPAPTDLGHGAVAGHAAGTLPDLANLVDDHGGQPFVGQATAPAQTPVRESSTVSNDNLMGHALSDYAANQAIFGGAAYLTRDDEFVLASLDGPATDDPTSTEG